MLTKAGAAVLTCSNIGKTYRLAAGNRTVLSDVSFDLKKGEVLGIIGANGAGKSTLLKILSGIVKPSEGRVELYGSSASVLDLGQNFHPDLTGTENVLMNLKVNGVTSENTAAKLAEITAFSELQEYMNEPVKHYSSGMLLRLGFALYTHLDADIILLDEIISVGDFNFRKKCSDKIQELVKKGVSFLITSHDLDAIHYLTERCILLQHGAAHVGYTSQVIESYLSNQTPVAPVTPTADGPSVLLTNAFTEPALNGLNSESAIQLHFHFQVLQPTELALSINMFFDQSLRLLSSSPVFYKPDAAHLYAPGNYKAMVQLPAQTFAPGLYDIDVVFHNGRGRIYGTHKKAISFSLASNPHWNNLLNQSNTPWALLPNLPWQIESHTQEEPVIIKDARLQQQLTEEGYTFFPPVPEATIDALAAYISSQMHHFTPETISCVSVTHPDALFRQQCQEVIYRELDEYLQQHFKDYQCVLGTFFVKRPSNISSVGYHQDPTFCDPELYPDLTLWIPLEDIGAGDGELVVVEGTHRSYNKLNLLTYTPDYIHQYKDGDGKVLYQQKGYPVLFYNHLLHASRPVVNKQVRLAISLKLAHKDALLYSYYKSTVPGMAERYKQSPNFFLSQDWQPFDRPQQSKFDKEIPIR